MLINPETHIVIRNCPLNEGYISCDQLNKDLKFIKELGSLQEDSMDRAFAKFANLELFEPTGFYDVSNSQFDTFVRNPNELTFNNLTDYYWGNSK